MKWEPQPWIVIPVLLVIAIVTAVGAFYLESMPRPPRVIDIHIIVDKAPQ